jgi:hypothetical protein
MEKPPTHGRCQGLLSAYPLGGPVCCLAEMNASRSVITDRRDVRTAGP